MAMICFMVCASFLISTVSAMTQQPMVVSAIVRNMQEASVECTVKRKLLGKLNAVFDDEVFTIRSNKYKAVYEKRVQISLSEHVGLIYEISCDELTLTAPFAGVRRPVTFWEFRVESDRIVSLGPTSYLP